MRRFQAVKALLLLGRDDDFRITGYNIYKSSPRTVGRDSQWKEMAEVTGLVGFNAYHLGGDVTLSWIIEVDRALRGEPTGEMTEVAANGGDM